MTHLILFWKMPVADVQSFASQEFSTDGCPLIVLGLDVDAIGGTSPEFDAILQTTIDGETWLSVGSPAEKTSTGLTLISVDAKTNPYSARCRVLVTTSGTSFKGTFSASVTLYPAS